MAVLPYVYALVLVAGIIGTATSQEECTSCSAGYRKQVQAMWNGLWGVDQGAASRRITIGRHVFADLLDRLPKARQLFARVNVDAPDSPEFAAHVMRVVNGLDVLINILGSRDALRSQLHHLGRQHKLRKGVIPHYFAALETSFANVLSRAAPEFNPDAWTACFEVITRGIVDGMNKAYAFPRARCDVSVDTGEPSQPVQGTIILTQTGGPTIINIDLNGFDQTDGQKAHGFHIHAEGGLGNRCKDAKGHYNPENLNHGGPEDSIRHVGDLGNVYEDDKGRVKTTLMDNKVKLEGPNNVIGKAIVIHAVKDDLGREGHSDSLTTGHAGARLACCVIRPHY